MDFYLVPIRKDGSVHQGFHLLYYLHYNLFERISDHIDHKKLSKSSAGYRSGNFSTTSLIARL